MDRDLGYDMIRQISLSPLVSIYQAFLDGYLTTAYSHLMSR
jgi:hypothetical protein